MRSTLLAVTLVLASAPVAACESSLPASTATADSPASLPSPSPMTSSNIAAGHVDGATAKRLVKEGARLIDVRTPAEFAQKHIDGAENIPVDGIDARDVGAKDLPLVLYCGSGKRASRGADILREKGYLRVYELGPMSAWDESP